MPTIEFKKDRSGGDAGRPGAFGRQFTFVVPKFGDRCVCCSADAEGRLQLYDPSADPVQAPRVPVPVCGDCRSHALTPAARPGTLAALLLVGVAAILVGFVYFPERADGWFPLSMKVIGVALTVAGLVWTAAGQIRTWRLRGEGHHAGLMFTVYPARSTLTTTNESLAETLLQLNPSARRTTTRADHRRIPRATVLRTDDRERPGSGG